MLQLVQEIAVHPASARARTHASMSDIADSRSGGAAPGSPPMPRKSRVRASKRSRQALLSLPAVLCTIIATVLTPNALAAPQLAGSFPPAVAAARKVPVRQGTGGVSAALILRDSALPLSFRRQGTRPARVEVVEWADYECPYCKTFSTAIENELASFPTDINWTYRFFPLPGHGKSALAEAVAGACIARVMGSASFWRYTHEIFSTTRGDGEGPGAPMAAIMSGVRVATPGVATCIKDGEGAKMVQADRQLALRVGVLMTPTTFLIQSRTGRIVKVEGALKQARLDKVVRKLLSEQDPR